MNLPFLLLRFFFLTYNFQKCQISASLPTISDNSRTQSAATEIRFIWRLVALLERKSRFGASLLQTKISRRRGIAPRVPLPHEGLLQTWICTVWSCTEKRNTVRAQTGLRSLLLLFSDAQTVAREGDIRPIQRTRRAWNIGLTWDLHLQYVFVPLFAPSLSLISSVFSADALELEDRGRRPGPSVLEPFHRCPTSSASFLCNYDPLELKYWPVPKVCYINMSKKEQLWDESLFCLLLPPFYQPSWCRRRSGKNPFLFPESPLSLSWRMKKCQRSQGQHTKATAWEKPAVSLFSHILKAAQLQTKRQ